MQRWEMEQVVPTGTAIYKESTRESAIDHIFETTLLSESLISCGIAVWPWLWPPTNPIAVYLTNKQRKASSTNDNRKPKQEPRPYSHKKKPVSGGWVLKPHEWYCGFNRPPIWEGADTSCPIRYSSYSFCYNSLSHLRHAWNKLAQGLKNITYTIKSRGWTI